MKIAQVAPLTESVPPQTYGGTERVVAYLIDELAALGHEVTLFASGDSRTAARLESGWPRALRRDDTVREPLIPHMTMLETVARRAGDFDILHCHVDYICYPLLSRIDVPFLCTLHGRLDLPELRALYRLFDDVPLVSISDAQRRPLPDANYVATVHHGLPATALRRGPGGDYLAFLGRISPEKAPDAAIRVARRTGLPLKIAAKIDRVDSAYFAERIAPLLDDPLVEFIGEIGEADKQEFLGNAAALLFPLAWSEPFGLVMIEAMACGTPVIAWRDGSVPEVVDHGLTGFVVENEDQAVAAVRELPGIDRRTVRRGFEDRFTARRMALDYLAAYRRLADGRAPLREVV